MDFLTINHIYHGIVIFTWNILFYVHWFWNGYFYFIDCNAPKNPTYSMLISWSEISRIKKPKTVRAMNAAKNQVGHGVADSLTVAHRRTWSRGAKGRWYW